MRLEDLPGYANGDEEQYETNVPQADVNPLVMGGRGFALAVSLLVLLLR
jgi:hypothetical protein